MDVGRVSAGREPAHYLQAVVPLISLWLRFEGRNLLLPVGSSSSSPSRIGSPAYRGRDVAQPAVSGLGILTRSRPCHGGRIPEKGVVCHRHYARRRRAKPVARTRGHRRRPLEIETLDINEPDQLAALYGRLTGRMVDMLFVNTGITNPNDTDTIGAGSPAMFVQIMLTNALSPCG